MDGKTLTDLALTVSELIQKDLGLWSREMKINKIKIYCYISYINIIILSSYLIYDQRPYIAIPAL